MTQMILPDDILMEIDFTNNSVPKSVKTFHPSVFHDGSSFCCLLGPDPQEGVMGCGSTMMGALEDWDRQLNLRLDHHYSNDEFALYVEDALIHRANIIV